MNSNYSNKECLLLTGTINPSKKLKDYGQTLVSETRLRSYLSTLCFYITSSSFVYIVFCENSQYNLDKYKDYLYGLAKVFNKKLEIIQYNGNHKASEILGFGYGESECIDYAVDHSMLLKDVDSFRKITGRYIYSNINNLVLDSSHSKTLFFKNFSQVVGIYTALFKVDKNLYMEHLYGIREEINLGISLEYLYYKKLANKKLANKKYNYGKLKEIPIRIPAIPFDCEEVKGRGVGKIGYILFFIGQRNFSVYSMLIDRFLIFLMNCKHRVQNLY